MPRRTRTAAALAVTAASLVTAASATAVPGTPVQKNGPSFAEGTSVTMAWDAAVFSAGSKNRGYIYEVRDLTDGGAVDIEDNLPSTSLSVNVPGRQNGHLYRLTVRAVEAPCTALLPGPPALCLAHGAPVVGPASTQLVRMDATDPTGSMSVNGGAQYSTSRDVLLSLSASDPLSAGEPSSGIDGAQISQDATFTCQPVTGSTAECPVAVTPNRPYTLDEGPDGTRTVRVRYRDKAAPFNPGALTLVTVTGNASAVVSDTIILDRSQPTPVVVTGVPSADAGVQVAFSASSSTDATSGIDPATAVWDFGDGTAPVNALQLNKSFAAPGTYTGSLTIKDRAGNTNTQAFQFTVTGAPAPGGGGVTVTDPGTTAGPAVDPLLGAKRLNRAVQGKRLKIRVRLGSRVQVRVAILRVSSSGKAVVRRQSRTGGPGFMLFTFTAPKAGRHIVRVTAGSDRLTFPIGIARR